MNSISRTPSIYQIRHIESGKIYVGSSVNPHDRWMHHRNDLRRGEHRSRYLQRAWEKYGESAFVFEIIEPVLFVEDLISREQYWLDHLRAASGAYGYNTSPTAGSSLGLKHTPESRAKISAQSKAQYASPEARAQQSARAIARNASSEAREKQSAAAKAWYANPDERAKVSAQSRERWADPEYRARMSLKHRERYADPSVRETAAARTKVRFADPAQRAKVAAKNKTHWEDPAVRANASTKMKARWADPEYRAEQLRRRAERKQRDT